MKFTTETAPSVLETAGRSGIMKTITQMLINLRGHLKTAYSNTLVRSIVNTSTARKETSLDATDLIGELTKLNHSFEDTRLGTSSSCLVTSPLVPYLIRKKKKNSFCKCSCPDQVGHNGEESSDSVDYCALFDQTTPDRPTGSVFCGTRLQDLSKQ